MIERILVRMPEDFEYFLPAASVVQNYISQQYMQFHQRQKIYEPRFTIEFGDESHLYLNSMFPRMGVTVREDAILHRADWECVLDMTDIQRVLTVASPTNKHITEAWSAMFGASAPTLPMLGPIAAVCQNPTYDFLIDTELDCAEELAQRINSIVEWGVTAQAVAVNNQRVFQQFQLLADCKVFVGKRSGASYLAATMRKGCVEVWPKTIPFWFLHKSQSEGYRVLISERPSMELLLDQVKSVCPLLVSKAA